MKWSPEIKKEKKKEKYMEKKSTWNNSQNFPNLKIINFRSSISVNQKPDKYKDNYIDHSLTAKSQR